MVYISLCRSGTLLEVAACGCTCAQDASQYCRVCAGRAAQRKSLRSFLSYSSLGGCLVLCFLEEWFQFVLKYSPDVSCFGLVHHFIYFLSLDFPVLGARSKLEFAPGFSIFNFRE